MAAHLYWRLNIAAVDGGTVIGIAEIEMRTSPGGANVATGGTATASGQQAGSEASKAFDASNSTNWLCTAAVTQGWIRYQFATAQDIVEHAVMAPNATTNRAPKQWSIQWSDDGNTWETAAIVNNQTAWGTSENRVFTHSSWPTNIGFCPQLPNAVMAITADVPAFTTRAPIKGSDFAYKVYSGPTKTISGTVKQNGTPVQRMVRAYHRKTGQCLGETLSAAGSGAFSINALGWTDECYVVAFDDLTQSPDYNAQIFDLVIPV